MILLFFAFSCKEDSEPVGKINIKILNLDQTKNQVFQLDVLNSNGLNLKEIEGLTSPPESMILKPGEYQISVQSMNSNPITNTDVIFSGKSEKFVVSPGKNDTIQVSITIDSLQGWVVVPNVQLEAKEGASSFIIGDNIYIGLGFNSSTQRTKDWWKFSIENNTWEQLNDFPGGVRSFVGSFSAGNKGYLFLGYADGNERLLELWEFDAEKESWTRLKDFPGVARDEAVAIVTESEVYIGSGIADGVNSLSDFYSYKFATNEWTEISQFLGDAPYGSSSFTINNEGHLICGVIKSDVRTKLHYKYNVTDNSWVELPLFSGTERLEGATFNIYGIGYFGLGSISNNVPGTDLWKFDPGTNSWKEMTGNVFTGKPRFASVYGSNGKLGYFGFGRFAGTLYKDLYLYYPEKD